MFLKREKNLNALINAIGTPEIKIITGSDDLAKSKLLESLNKYIEKNVDDENVIFIDYNKPKFEKMKDYRKLYEYISSNYREDMDNIVLIDDIELCDGFENAINRIRSEKTYDIFITGSDSFLLSSDLTALFAGKNLSDEFFILNL